MKNIIVGIIVGFLLYVCGGFTYIKTQVEKVVNNPKIEKLDKATSVFINNVGEIIK